MTKIEFAQKIKSKYPQYQGMEDNSLADKVLAKYPVYQSQITETAPESGNSVFKSLSENVEGSAQSRAKNIQEITDAYGKGEQGAVRSSLQVGGEFVGGTIVDPLMNVLKTFAPGVPKAIEAVGQNYKQGLENGGSIDPLTNVLHEVVQFLSKNPSYQKFANSPAAKPLERDIKAINEYTALLAPEKAATTLETGVTKVLEPLATGIDKTKQFAQAVVDKPGELVSGAKGKIEEMAIDPIPKPVESVLKETKQPQFDEYARAAQKATESYKNATPLEIAGQKAQKALDVIQKKLNVLGKQKGDMMGLGGIATTPVDGTMVKKFYERMQSYLNSKTAVEGDKKIIRDIVSEAQKLGDTPAAGQVDKFIDFVQDKIYTSGRDLTVPVTDETTSALRQFTGELNRSLKSQLPEQYGKLNDEYSSLIDVRNELNTKLGKEGEKGGSLMKRVFSPSDANTKKLFEDVKGLTGIDLVNEATLARFLMELVGDARQASLLEQLQLPRLSNLSQKGLVQMAIDFGLKRFLKKVNSPEAKIGRARDLTNP